MASYEEARQRRIEENKKRMLELNLNVLSRALKPTKPQQVGTIQYQSLLFNLYTHMHV